MNWPSLGGTRGILEAKGRAGNLDSGMAKGMRRGKLVARVLASRARVQLEGKAERRRRPFTHLAADAASRTTHQQHVTTNTRSAKIVGNKGT